MATLLSFETPLISSYLFLLSILFPQIFFFMKVGPPTGRTSKRKQDKNTLSKKKSSIFHLYREKNERENS